MAVFASFLENLVAWATVGTAIGTLVLAAATYGLALRTRQLAVSSTAELDLLRVQTVAAQRQSVAAEAALLASVRPFLLDVPPQTLREVRRDDLSSWIITRGRREIPPPETTKVDVSTVYQEVRAEQGDLGEPAFSLDVPVRNVGAGVAMIDEVKLLLEGQAHVLSGSAPATALPAGEFTHLTFEVTVDAPNWAFAQRAVAGKEQLVAAVVYTDSTGEQAARTELRLMMDEDDLYEVARTRVVPVADPFPSV